MTVKERTKVQCPECDRWFPHQGALNLHLSRSECGGGEQGNKTEPDSCPECGGALRALRKNVIHERYAMSEGYKEVCTKCKELI